PAQKASGPAATVQSDQYEFFEVPGITDQRALEDYARRAWEEYARQQVEGAIETHEMVLEREGGDLFDPLDLGAGDAVRIDFDSEDLARAKRYDTIEARADFLVGRGYPASVAELIAKNLDSFRRLRPVFHVKGMTAMIESTPDGGSFGAQIHYANV